MTLLELYGPQFEVVHKVCTCPSPRMSIGSHNWRLSNRYIPTKEDDYGYDSWHRCFTCGLEIHAREEMGR